MLKAYQVWTNILQISRYILLIQSFALRKATGNFVSFSRRLMHYLVLLDSKIAKKLDYLDYRFILKKAKLFFIDGL